MNTRRIGVTAIVSCQLLWPLASHAAVVSQSVPIEGAEEIEINVPIALHVEQGDHEALTLSTDDHEMKQLRVRQEGALLSIELTERDHLRFSSDSKVHATLVVRKLTALHLNGAGSVTLVSLKADRLELTIAGAGSMDLRDVKAGNIEVSIAGAGEIDASGVVDTLNIQVAGLGATSLEGLASRRSHVMISGGGTVKLAVSDELDASISGVGQVRYLGTPHVFKSISGIGSVEPVKD